MRMPILVVELMARMFLSCWLKELGFQMRHHVRVSKEIWCRTWISILTVLPVFAFDSHKKTN